MVCKLIAGEVPGAAFVNFRQHGCIPFVPFRHEPLVDIPLAVLQVGALHRVVDHVEQECVLENFEKLVISVACRPLRVCLVAPEQPAGDWGDIRRQQRQQVHPVRREGAIGRRPCSGNERWQPVHADRHLIGGPAPGTPVTKQIDL